MSWKDLPPHLRRQYASLINPKPSRARRIAKGDDGSSRRRRVNAYYAVQAAMTNISNEDRDLAGCHVVDGRKWVSPQLACNRGGISLSSVKKALRGMEADGRVDRRKIKGEGNLFFYAI